MIEKNDVVKIEQMNLRIKFANYRGWAGVNGISDPAVIAQGEVVMEELLSQCLIFNEILWKVSENYTGKYLIQKMDAGKNDFLKIIRKICGDFLDGKASSYVYDSCLRKFSAFIRKVVEEKAGSNEVVVYEKMKEIRLLIAAMPKTEREAKLLKMAEKGDEDFAIAAIFDSPLKVVENKILEKIRYSVIARIASGEYQLLLDLRGVEGIIQNAYETILGIYAPSDGSIAAVA